MGAWGPGILQDDTALDFLDELRAAPNPIARLSQAFDAALNADYLEYDEGQAALVSAAIVDAVLRGTNLKEGDEELGELLATFDAAETKPLQAVAAQACRRLLAPASELHELWAENQDEFPHWRQQVEGLASRLAK